jgi:4-amino-4-deoxychorismate lyase
MMIWVDGELCEQLPISDRGLQYGDGVWETIRIAQGQPIFWQPHLERLLYGLRVLGISLNTEQLETQVSQCLVGVDTGILKIIVTRGSGGRGYLPPPNSQPRIILSVHPVPAYPESYYESGIEITLCETRLSHNPQLAGFKHLNRLEQVLARKELGSKYPEGLVRDYADHVIEGTMTNLFIVKDEKIFTPDLTFCGIKGVMREFIMQRCNTWGIDVEVLSTIKMEQLLMADALFLCNSVIGVWSVKHFQNKNYSISALSKNLQAEFEACL